MSGYSKKELLAMSISDLEAVETNIVTDDHIIRSRRRVRNVLNPCTAARMGAFLMSKSASNTTPKARWIVAFLRDITNRKRAEEELHERETA